jgi:hypothetical protein
MLSLVAQAQLTATGDQKDLLDVDNLVTATQKVYYFLESRWALQQILQSIQSRTIHGMPPDQFPPNSNMSAAATVITYQ